MASSSAHQRVVGDEGQAAGALDGHSHLTLVLGAVPRDPPRDDLPALGHEVLQHRLVLEVGVTPLLGAEAAHLLAAEAAASAALLVVATRPTAPPPPPPRHSAHRPRHPPRRREGRRPENRFRFRTVQSYLAPARVARSGLLRRLLVQALTLHAVPRRTGALRSRTAGLVHVTGQL